MSETVRVNLLSLLALFMAGFATFGMVPLMCNGCGHHRLGWSILAAWSIATGYLIWDDFRAAQPVGTAKAPENETEGEL